MVVQHPLTQIRASCLRVRGEGEGAEETERSGGRGQRAASTVCLFSLRRASTPRPLPGGGCGCVIRGHSRQLTGAYSPAGLQTRAGGVGRRGAVRRVHAVPRARPEGSSRCPYNSPRKLPRRLGLVGQPLRPRGPPGPARGEEGWTTGVGTGSGPACPPQAPPPPSPSPTASPPEAPPGRLPRLCNPRYAIFPSKLRLFPGSHRNLATLGVSCPGRPALVPKSQNPLKPPLLQPLPPAVA